jgi:predicted dehydrogenase
LQEKEMSKVRVGIIGMGSIGTVHAKALQTVPEAELTAICDALPDRLKEKGEAFKAQKQYADFRDMLRDCPLDAVFVCVGNWLHCDATVAALKAGAHVLCEKPMALNAAQAKRMVAAAREAGKVLQMGMVWRHKAEAQTVKDCIERGDLGEVYHIRVVLRRRRGIPGLGGWFTTKAQSGGGALIDIGVHFFDLVMWLTDQWRPTRVSAQTYAKFGARMKDYVYLSMWAGPPNYGGVFDVDDYATGLARFGAGCTMSFEVSWAGNNEQGNYVEILGDKGGVRAFGGQPITLFTEVNGRLADIQLQFANNEHFNDQARNFVRAAMGKEKPKATGEQGLILMRLLDAVYKSGQTGKEVEIADK